MRFIRTVIFILVCVGLIWLVVFIFSSIFSSGNQTTVTPATKLSSYANSDATVKYTLDGPVVLNQEHRLMRISVSRSQSQIELIQGYDGSLIKQDAFPNTEASYTVFLRALDILNFSKGNAKKYADDERGQCPLENRYIYQLSNANGDIFRYWSTSCGTGTFGGSISQVRTLFTRQIPSTVLSDYSRALSIR